MNRSQKILGGDGINEMWNVHDDVLEGLSFQDLIDTVIANEKTRDKRAIEKVFKDILKEKVDDAKFMLKSKMKDILKVVEQDTAPHRSAWGE